MQVDSGSQSGSTEQLPPSFRFPSCGGWTDRSHCCCRASSHPGSCHSFHLPPRRRCCQRCNRHPSRRRCNLLQEEEVRQKPKQGNSGSSYHDRAVPDSGSMCADAQCHTLKGYGHLWASMHNRSPYGRDYPNAIWLMKLQLRCGRSSGVQRSPCGLAPPRQRPLRCAALAQIIGTISFTPNTLTVGGAITARATATSGLAVTFSSTTQSICTVSATTVIGVAGTCTVAADQAGNNNYSAAMQVTQDIAVKAVDLTPILMLLLESCPHSVPDVHRRKTQATDRSRSPQSGLSSMTASAADLS